MTTLSISLPPEAQAKLSERAAAHGQDESEFASRLLAQALQAASIDEILAPFRQQVADSRMSDDDFDGMCDELRGEVWAAKQAFGG